MEDAGFEVVAQLPIEGLGILARDFDSLWSDPRKRSPSWSYWPALKELKK